MERDAGLKLLRGGPDGIQEWNRLREEGAEIPFLSAADLRGAYLAGADLRFASLALGLLNKADLSGVDLSGASLRRADLFQTKLCGATLINADLRAADMTECDLSGADLTGADLTGTDLSGANLGGATLDQAMLVRTDLRKADLCGASLREAQLVGTFLSDADLSGAVFGGTVIACCLTGVHALDATIHHTPSPLSVSSALSLGSPAPIDFLRGCGLRREEIEHFRRVCAKPVRFDACYLSFAHRDHDLADHLFEDLQAVGIRCWKRCHHHRQADDPIHGEPATCADIERDDCGVSRLVLIASEASLTIPAVNREVDWAISREQERRRLRDAGSFEGDCDVLIPVVLDDFIEMRWSHERMPDVIVKDLLDARDWNTDSAVYEMIRDRLIAMLQSPPAGEVTVAAAASSGGDRRQADSAAAPQAG